MRSLKSTCYLLITGSAIRLIFSTNFQVIIAHSHNYWDQIYWLHCLCLFRLLLCVFFRFLFIFILFFVFLYAYARAKMNYVCNNRKAKVWTNHNWPLLFHCCLSDLTIVIHSTINHCLNEFVKTTESTRVALTKSTRVAVSSMCNSSCQTKIGFNQLPKRN